MIKRLLRYLFGRKTISIDEIKIRFYAKIKDEEKEVKVFTTTDFKK